MTTAPQIAPVSVRTLAGYGGSPAGLVWRHAFNLLSPQGSKSILNRVAEGHPKVAEDQPRVVEDGAPKLLAMASVVRVLQILLRERVSIRDSVTILETGSVREAIRSNGIQSDFSGTVEAAMESARKEPGEEAPWIGMVAAPRFASRKTIGAAA